MGALREQISCSSGEEKDQARPLSLWEQAEGTGTKR